MNCHWDDWLIRILYVLCAPAAMLAVLFIAAFPFVLAWELFHPCQTSTLQANQWRCSSTFEERYFTGKVWATRTVCAAYRREDMKEGE